MGRYIHWGLRQAGHTVWSCGMWSRGEIPWGDFTYPEKYWYPPTIEMPDAPEIPMEDLFKSVKEAGIKPDLFISAADNYFVTGKCPIPHILIGTDPHAVDYNSHLRDVHHYVSMQKFYSNGAYWMPYGYDPTLHEVVKQDKKYDVVFCGLQYEHRLKALEAIKAKGWRVFNSLGLIYKEYVEVYNQGSVAFNWSSRNDLPARFWEGLAMRRCVVTNNVPDLKEFSFVEGKDYLGFDTLEEAVEKTDWVLKRPDKRMMIAESGYRKVFGHTYKNRVRKMLEDLL